MFYHPIVYRIKKERKKQQKTAKQPSGQICCPENVESVIIKKGWYQFRFGTFSGIFPTSYEITLYCVQCRNVLIHHEIKETDKINTK